ncbi:MAG: glycosyltransferase family 4 protein [Acidobacteriota bacterium]|nr:glycosyltransferase family 4 protein [Acidobacteriota bacterium]
MPIIGTTLVASTTPHAVSGVVSQTADASRELTVALVDWSHLIEDFLDNIGVSFESFCEEMSGGWMFGYVEALRSARVRTVLFCVSARVSIPTRFTHRATGATICVLPAPRIYRRLRRRVLNPYANTVEEAVGNFTGLRRTFFGIIKNLMPYLSTPVAHLARELRREGCDAILCQDYEHGRFDECVLLGKLMRLPVFATFQGGCAPLSCFESFVRSLSLRAAAGLIVATKCEAERVRATYDVRPERITRIFNPVDLKMWPDAERDAARREFGIPAAARVVLWHGRVDYRRKGLDVLLDAWEQVYRALPSRDLRLMLIGSGNNADELRERIAAVRPPGVRWVGEYINDRARLRRYLAAADIYVFPSRHEGFPVAPIEAMACGLPLVAADAPGVPEILEGGEASGGIIVPRGDAQSLAAALNRLLDDETLSRELGRRARVRIEKNFSLETVGEQLRGFLTTRGVRAVESEKRGRDSVRRETAAKRQFT